MKEEIFIFGNSMCCTPKKESYLDLLKQDFDVNGLWFRGMTIWHIDIFIRNIVRGDSSWIIINVGVTEAITRSSHNILYYWMNELQKYGEDSNFQKMYPYLKYLCLHPQEFDNIIPLTTFQFLFDSCMLENHKIIVVGLAYPQNLDNENRFECCKMYNDFLKRYDNFIDVWYNDFSVDEAHLNREGHNYVYNLIKEKING